MNRAKSTRRVMLLARMGSPTCRLHDGEALALALLQVTPAHDGPARVAFKYPSARLHLVVEVGEANKTRERPSDFYDRSELPRVHVRAVTRDVPSAREHEACAWTRVIEHGLGRSGRVAVDAARDENGEHSVAPLHRALDYLAVVRRSRNDRDAILEPIELLHALLAAHAHHLVAAIERVLNHVLPELPRGSDDADLAGGHDVIGVIGAGVGETASGALSLVGSSPPMSSRKGG